jgi:hypothetical protein
MSDAIAGNTLFHRGKLQHLPTFRAEGCGLFKTIGKMFSRVGKKCIAKGGKDENFSVIKGAKPSHPTLDGKSFR